jgi:hypothetical protein
MQKLYQGLSIGLIMGVVILGSGIVQAAQDDAATSVVVNIRTLSKEVASAVHQELAQRIEAMLGRFEENLRQGNALLERAKQAKEGKAGLVAAFENQLAKTMQEAGEGYKTILGQEERAQEALHKLESALTAGRQFHQGRVTQLQATWKQLTDDRQKLEGQLRTLAGKYREVINNGQLPATVDALVRDLEIDRKHMAMLEQIQEQRVAGATDDLRHLEDYETYIGQLRGLSQVAFKQARGQLDVLSALASLRTEAINRHETQRITAELGTATGKFRDALERGFPLLTQMMNLPRPGDVDDPQARPVAKSPIPQGEGVEILRQYLKPDLKSAVAR